MMAQIYVACDGNWSEPEVQISGSAKDLADFGVFLNSVTESTSLEVPVLDSEFYPVSVKRIVIEPAGSGDDRIIVTIDEDNFNLTGTKVALNKLGDSLINFFDKNSITGEHFQLDYYEGNKVLSETNCHFIFICDR
ncbi:hypothetical protein ABGI61_05165 [Rheinheimera sp. FR7-31]|uniref:hypothetical protein n=1 Tax=Rheinheimera fenheensis TaxID=3152295 RepID=UPI00325D0419